MNGAPIVEEPKPAGETPEVPGADPAEGGHLPDTTARPPYPTPAPQAGPTGPGMITQEAFEARLGSEVSKRKALEEKLAALEGRLQPAEEPAEEQFRFEAWDGFKSQYLKDADANTISFFNDLHSSFMRDVDRAVYGFVQDRLSPFEEKDRTQAREGFFSKNPVAREKEAEIQKLIERYPGMPYEDAWKLVNYGNTAPAPRKLPPPGGRPSTPGAPMSPNGVPKGKGIGAIIEHVMNQRGQ